VLIPWLAWRSRSHLASRAATPRARHFVNVLVQLALFLVISLVVAFAENIQVWRPVNGRWLPWTCAALLTIAGILLMLPRWHQTVKDRDPVVRLFMPITRRERRLWVAVAVMAAVSEEVTYRGVLFVLLWVLTDSVWAAAIVAAVVFGVSHVVQGWKTAGIVTIIALLLHGLVALSGTLYPAIVAHAVYDIVAGLTYGRLGRSLGYDVTPPPDQFPEPLPAP
jgi:membrane protease YdiL (CAAX protease family)